jgi:hypothetical protein
MTWVTFICHVYSELSGHVYIYIYLCLMCTFFLIRCSLRWTWPIQLLWNMWMPKCLLHTPNSRLDWRRSGKHLGHLSWDEEACLMQIYGMRDLSRIGTGFVTIYTPISLALYVSHIIFLIFPLLITKTFVMNLNVLL